MAADQKVGFQAPTVIPLQRQWTTTIAQFLTSKRVPSCTRSRPGRTAGRNKGTVHKGSNHTGNSTAVAPVHCRRTAPVTTPAATAPGNHQPHQAFAFVAAALAVAGSSIVYAQEHFTAPDRDGPRIEHRHRLSPEDRAAFVDARIAAL